MGAKEDIAFDRHDTARSWKYIGVAFLASLLLFYPFSCALNRYHSRPLQTADVCPQVEPLAPSSDANRKLSSQLDRVFADPSFEAVAAEYLGAAVRIPTESFDDMGPVGQDPRWDVFHDFSSHLLEAYPKVHATLTQTRINTHALLYHWPGSDPSLKPILLTAHQDVVPVDPKTASSWVHPPFSGHYDGTWIWGRGASDDKSGLIGIMVALEKLVGNGFKPKRGILLGFGMDEETSGNRGASEIGRYIEEHFGKNSVAVVVDEGGTLSDVGGVTIARPAVTEKTYCDVRIEVATPGGHSSVPPDHTSIGILATLLVKLESMPYAPQLKRSSPVYQQMQCYAAHVSSLPESFRHAVLESVCPAESSSRQQARCDAALERVEEQLFDAKSELNAGDELQARTYRSLLQTTQAIDVINGGVKSNALPELVSAIVNHRISIDSSPSALEKAMTSKLVPLARKFNLTMTSFGQNITTGGHGTLTLSEVAGAVLGSTPVTPTEGQPGAAYRLLSGVIRETRGGKTIVSPAIMTGNTDTRHYWNVTPNIFRYAHLLDKDKYNGIHTINEATRASGLVEEIRFFKNFILAADDSDEI